jgi:hypothetical protein
MSILKYFSIILVALVPAVCQAEIAIEALVPGERSESPSVSSDSTQEPSSLKVTPLSLAIDLVDGSHIIGVPSIKTVSVQTQYATIDIPFKQILSMKIGDDHETVSFELQNGDKLTGVLNLEPMQLETIFGHVSVDVQHVRSIRVRDFKRLSASLRQGLVLWYSFDRDEGNVVTDKSGKNNHGKVHRAKWTEKGKAGGACKFDGSGRSIELADDDSLDIGTGSFTVLAWIHTGAAPGDSWMVVDKGTTEAGTYYLYSDGSSVRMTVKSATKRYDAVMPDTDFPYNQWVCVAGVYDESSVKLFVDSTEIASASAPADLGSNTRPVTIGKYQRAGYQFSGIIDEVMIFNRALSKQEIKHLYNSQK